MLLWMSGWLLRGLEAELPFGLADSAPCVQVTETQRPVPQSLAKERAQLLQHAARMALFSQLC